MDEPSGDLGLLVAERAIERTLHRYCRGIDRLLPEVVRSCFHADADDDHGDGPCSRDDFVAWAFALLASYESTMHLITNVLIDVRDTVALAESYGIAHHRGPLDQTFVPRHNLITGFRFIDRFELRDGGWAIARRVATTEWSRVDDAEGRWPVADSLRRGSRDETDPIHWLVPEVSGR